MRPLRRVEAHGQISDLSFEFSHPFKKRPILRCVAHARAELLRADPENLRKPCRRFRPDRPVAALHLIQPRPVYPRTCREAGLRETTGDA